MKPGHTGWPRTLLLRWRAPASSGGAPVTAYEVRVWKVTASGKAVRAGTYSVEAPSRRLKLVLDNARYRFTVAATNFVGTGPRSLRSKAVRAR